MTSRSHAYPTRVPLRFKGKDGWVVLGQIRTVDKARLIKKLGRLQPLKYPVAIVDSIANQAYIWDNECWKSIYI